MLLDTPFSVPLTIFHHIPVLCTFLYIPPVAGAASPMLSPTGREDKFSPLKPPDKDIVYEEMEEFYVKYKNL